MPSAAVITLNDTRRDNFVTGKIVTADPAAALNVSIGFIPKWVEITNVTNPSYHRWNANMADGKVYQFVGNTGPTLVATGGITPYEGSASASPGFTIGTDAVLNTAADELHFIAYR